MLLQNATPIVEFTKQVVYLNDGEIAILNEEKGLKLYDHDEDLQDPYIEELELHLEALEGRVRSFYAQRNS